MSTGDILIALAAVTSLGAALTRAVGMRSSDKRLSEVSAALSVLTFSAVTTILLLLTYYFLSSDMSFYYVWHYSSTDLSQLYRLSGVWAGAAGSFLLWIWFMTLVLATEVVLEPRRKHLSKAFHGVFQIVVALIIFLFVALLAYMNLFERTGSFLLGQYPNGYGMSLVLQTPEMVVHPPVVFAGYAFCVVAFAAGASYFVTKDANWFHMSLPWARLGWIFLTLGIGIGAIWAYYVLGWGGYWAWDPVETSSLLPWILMTAFLHTQVRHVRKGEYKVSSPTLGMLSFVSVIFATFATRAGSIWSSSVHNFGSSVGASGGARLGYLLSHDSIILGIFSLMLALFAVTLLFAYSKYRTTASTEEEPEGEKLADFVSDKNNMLLTVVLLVVTGAIMLLLLFKNVNVSQSANYDEFNQKMSIFFVGLMATMSVCMVWKFLGKQVALWLGSGLVVVSVIAAVAGSIIGFNGLVAFSLPSYAVAVGASAFRFAKSRVAGSFRKTLQRASPHLIHMGVALVLLSFVVSSNMQSFPSDLERVQGTNGTVMSLGDQVNVGGFTVKLVSLNVRNDDRTFGTTSVQLAQDATLDVLRSGSSLRTGVVLTNLYGVSNGKVGVIKVEVFVYKSALNDLYLDYQWMTNATAFVQMKVVPLMNILWAGFSLLVVGLTLRTVSWQQEPKLAGPPKKKEGRAQAKPSGTEPRGKDYEALVEEELRKYKEMRKS